MQTNRERFSLIGVPPFQGIGSAPHACQGHCGLLYRPGSLAKAISPPRVVPVLNPQVGPAVIAQAQHPEVGHVVLEVIPKINRCAHWQRSVILQDNPTTALGQVNRYGNANLPGLFAQCGPIVRRAATVLDLFDQFAINADLQTDKCCGRSCDTARFTLSGNHYANCIAFSGVGGRGRRVLPFGRSRCPILQTVRPANRYAVSLPVLRPELCSPAGSRC